MSNQADQLELWKGAYSGPQQPLYTHRRTLGGKRVLVPGSARLKGDRAMQGMRPVPQAALCGQDLFQVFTNRYPRAGDGQAAE